MSAIHQIGESFSRYTETTQVPTASTDHLRLASTAIDAAIERLHSTFPPQADTQQFTRDSAWLRRAINSADSLIKEESHQPDDYVAYYSLLARKTLALEMIVMPTLFSHPDTSHLREFASGIAPKTIPLLEQTLADYDAAEIGRRGISGAIGELTALCLINLPKDNDIVAVPSSLKEDLTMRTDVHLYHRLAADGYVYRASGQVKSTADTTPAENGININGEDMNNLPEHNYMTARALIALFTTGQLSTKDRSRLNNTSWHLQRDLRQRLADTPGERID